jgi:quinol monooxygenase YgiN
MMRAPRVLSCVLVLATACAADDDDPAADDGADDSTSQSSAEESSSTGPDVMALYECTEPIMDARPLSGPGYDPATGVITPMQDSYVISTTQILPRPEKQSDFFALVGMVTADLDQRDGMIAYSLGLEPTCGFARTISVWRDEAAMMAFATGDAHMAAVGQSFDVGITGRVMHFTLPASEMPVTWDVAAARIAEIAPFY